MTGNTDKSVRGSIFKSEACVQQGLWSFQSRRMYQPGMLPMPIISTAFPTGMWTSRTYEGPGPPSQQLAKVTVRGIGGGSVSVGAIVAVSVHIEVGVSVGGLGIGEDAAAVCVMSSNAACATAVPTTSPGSRKPSARRPCT
jgi:hypothetical protein